MQKVKTVYYIQEKSTGKLIKRYHGEVTAGKALKKLNTDGDLYEMFYVCSYRF